MKTKMAFKFRAYPSRSQQRFIEMCLHNCWWFYRYVLHHYEDDYQDAKKNYRQVLSYYDGNIAFHPFWFRREPGKIKIPSEYYPRGAPLHHQGAKLVVRYNENGERILIPLSYFGDLTKNLSPILPNEEIIETSTYQLLSKVRNDRKYLQKIPAVIMQEVLERVDHAFKKFFKEGSGYPKYPKEKNYSSITWTSAPGIKLHKEESLLKLQGLPGLLKIEYHRPIKGTIKRVNLSRDILGQYYVSLMCEFEAAETHIASRGVVGIDANIKQNDINSRSFITLSTGEKIDIPRWMTRSEKNLAIVSRQISLLAAGSPAWRKKHRIIKHIHERNSNRKEIFLHTVSSRLAKEFSHVIVEDIDLTVFKTKTESPDEFSNTELQMQRGMRKGWTETSYGEFRRQLSYKLGDRLIKVNPAYTSKTCNGCGYVNKNLNLGDRDWKCPKCNAVLDRDVNAAMNIRDAGLAFISKSIKMQEETA